MDWQKGERSQNVEVDSGGGGGPRFGGGRGLGIGGIVILAILGLVFFKDPTALLSQVDTGGQVAAPSGGQTADVDPQTRDFVSAVLGSTEKTWGDLFAAHGRQYVDPKLDLFTGGVKVYERQHVILHAKTLLVDDIAVVGSTNLDYRSIEFNCEISAVVRSAAFAKELSRLFDHDKRYAQEIEQERWKQRSWRARTAQWIVTHFRQLL